MAAQSGGFAAGAHVEYYSKSYDEWIPAVVAAVRPDGNLKLLHEDGTVLKEQATPSLCRASQTSKTPEKKPQAGRSPASAAAVGTPRRKTVPPSPKPGPAVRRPGSRGAPPKASAPRPDARSAVQSRVAPAARVSRAGAPAGGGCALQEPQGYAETLNQQQLYVGDRAKIRDSGRQGYVMYIGTPSFSSSEVVGLRLDDKRSKSDCDGKGPNNERLFRCPAGFGVFVSSEDVDYIPNEEAGDINVMPAPDEQLNVWLALENLTGLKVAKEQLTKLGKRIEVQKKREELGVSSSKPLHFGFRGSRGTGMSTIGHLLAHWLRDLEVLRTGQLLEVSKQELFAGFAAEGDVAKQLAKLWRAASGGVLMLNDAHLIAGEGDRSREEQGQEASEWLYRQIQQMESRCTDDSAATCWPQKVVVVFAAPLDSQLPKLLQGIGLTTIDFPDFSVSELAQVLVKLIEKRKFSLSDDLTVERLEGHVRDAKLRAAASGEKNMILMQRLLEEAIARQTERAWSTETVSLQGLTTLAPEDFEDNLTPSQDEVMKAALSKLDTVVGLTGVKNFVHSLYAQLKTEMQRREAGIGNPKGAGTLHMIFTGNPGTGKTTIARIIAELLAAMGLLRKGHLVEADRTSLVAGYSGQTALKTQQVVEQAMGGVLFIDEAYSLVSEDGKDSFGKEALDMLIKMIEDRRQDLVVILAGYPEEMQRLIATNPGVSSRFPVQVHFDDYNEEELMQIAEKMLLDDVLVLSHGATQALAAVLPKYSAPGMGRQHGNGRAVRNILEQAKRKMAVRLQRMEKDGRRSQTELCTMEASDFQ